MPWRVTSKHSFGIANPMKAKKGSGQYTWVTEYRTKKEAKAAEQRLHENYYNLVDVTIEKV